MAANKIDVLDAAGKKAGSVELPAALFDVETNVPLIHQVVVAQLAAARQGTHKTKTRGEVSGAGRKPFKQKGTGNARQGSIRAPHLTGGGVVHGPVPRDYAQRTPKKMIAAALRGSLSDRARAGRVHVISGLAVEAPSTKAAKATLEAVVKGRSTLVVVPRGDVLNTKSVRNLQQAKVIEAGQLNAYDVLVADDVVFTHEAFEQFVAGPATGKSAKGAATEAQAQKGDAE